tara:strand:- start:187 stop:453 length:267 start_codon:yes stop_codon:yes gene_type:complete
MLDSEVNEILQSDNVIEKLLFLIEKQQENIEKQRELNMELRKKLYECRRSNLETQKSNHEEWVKLFLELKQARLENDDLNYKLKDNTG